jgi:hypothetical protein
MRTKLMNFAALPAQDPSKRRIMSVQPDREHAFVEVIGPSSNESATDLRQRVDGLMVAGARYVLVDLTEAGGVEPATGTVIADACRQLTRRNGWLLVVGHDSQSVAARYSASLPDLFQMYQAVVQPYADRTGWRSGLTG